jgi:hypothetical protein
MGWLTNPRKAAYNRIYNRTTFDLFRWSRRGRAATPLLGLFGLGLLALWLFMWLFG